MKRHEGIPGYGTVVTSKGVPASGASRASYPLRAVCEYCGGAITCADGTADWAHVEPPQEA